MGLAGLFIVSDEEEAAAGLPAGEFDVPLVIQDRSFDPDNQLIYLGGAMMAGDMDHMGGMDHGGMMGGAQGMDGMQAMMDRFMGFLGDRILVNGAPDFVLPVATRPYRLRLLNGSNSRIYKLGWSDGAPFTVIGTDGGLLEKPTQHPYVMLAPGERIELWADFSGRRAGDELSLNSLAFSGAESEGMGRNQTLPLGAPFTIMKVRIERQVESAQTLPDRLSTIERHRLADAVNSGAPRTFSLTHQNMVWKINGRTFEMDAVADDERVKSGDLEVWEFVNETNPGEMMDPMGMAHPIHIHGVQFQVVDRQVLPELKSGWDAVQRRSCGRRMEGHFPAHAWRTGENAVEVRRAHRQIRVPLPQPGAREPGHDAQL